VGLPTTSGFTGEFLALMGYFASAWPQYLRGETLPIVLAAIAVSGVILGALYMLWLAQRLLFGAVKAPHMPLADLNLRERTILAALIAAIFWLGLFPAEPLGKTELAARHYQQLVTAPGTTTAAPVAMRDTP
jgi:NADH-quinone oxidoreductase subunit M